jgi:hypothetical protein
VQSTEFARVLTTTACLMHATLHVVPMTESSLETRTTVAARQHVVYLGKEGTVRFEHGRRGESQLVIVVGMVLMLVIGVVLDRMLLLEVLPDSRLRELLHLQSTESLQGTPETTTPKSPASIAPRYMGSAGGKVSGDVEMVSGPTYSSGYITGVIRNKSGKQLGMVRVDFVLYDASGNKVDTAGDMFGALGPGETWRYQAIVLDSQVATYKLVGVESY